MTHVNLEIAPAELQSAEIEIYAHLSQIIPHKHMIDVGAHLGSSFLPFLQAGWAVDAFEPLEANRLQLEQLYGGQPNVRIHPEAVSDCSGVKAFHLALKGDGSLHSFYHSLEKLPPDEFHTRGGTIRVSTASLDDLTLAGKIPREVGFLKIDTEGHDLPVLRGATLLQPDVIGVEFWGPEHALGECPSPLSDIASLLKARGYLKFIVVAHSGDATYYRYSDLNLGTKDWGNALFFSGSQPGIYEGCVKHLLSQDTPAPGVRAVSSVLRQLFDGAINFVDAGAYHGEFTAAVLEALPGSRGFMVEPVPANIEFLKARFQAQPEVSIAEAALSCQAGTRDLIISQNLPASSLLESCGEEEPLSRTPTKVETLDVLLSRCSGFDRLDFIKVQTQGHDLSVLHGALESIQRHRPVIMVESLFVPLYREQDSYFELFEFMNCNDYRLAGLFNVHKTHHGWLAFAELLFVPSRVIDRLLPPLDQNSPFRCSDPQPLVEENSFLRKTAEERLELIHHLTRVAEERLRVIEVLDTEVKRLRR